MAKQDSGWTRPGRIWDGPISAGRNCWSDDGILAIVSKESIQILLPQFDRNQCFSSTWVQLVKPDGNNDSKDESSGASRKSAVNGNDFILWIAQAGFAGEAVETNFEQAAWSPPGVRPGSPSLLATLLSNGMLLLFQICSCQKTEYLVSTGVKLHMFSTSFTLDISKDFSRWMAKQKVNNNKKDSNRESTFTRCDDVFPHTISSMAWYPTVIRTGMHNDEQRPANGLLLVTGSSHGSINVWLITPGSAERSINTSSSSSSSSSCSSSSRSSGSNAQSSSTIGWTSRCIGHFQLEDDSISDKDRVTPAAGCAYPSVTALQFIERSTQYASSSSSSSRRGTESSSSSSSDGDRDDALGHQLVCGTALGHVMVFNLSHFAGAKPSVHHDGENDDDDGRTRMLLSLKPILSRVFATGPIEALTVLKVNQRGLETALTNGNDKTSFPQSKATGDSQHQLICGHCGTEVALVMLVDGVFTPHLVIPHLHSSLITSIAILSPITAAAVAAAATTDEDSRSMASSDSLHMLTSSMDGRVILSALDVSACLEKASSGATSNNNGGKGKGKSSSSNFAATSSHSTTQQLQGSASSTFCPSVLPIKIISYRNDERSVGGGTLCSVADAAVVGTNTALTACCLVPVIDMTLDPCRAVMATTQIIPRVMSRDRETQMNPKRLRTSMEVVFELVPSLDPRWAFDQSLIKAVIENEVFAQVLTTPSGGAQDESAHEMIMRNSYYGGGCTSIGGLTLAWLRSVEKYVEIHLETGTVRCTRMPDALPTEQHGTSSENKVESGSSSSSSSSSSAAVIEGPSPGDADKEESMDVTTAGTGKNTEEGTKGEKGSDLSKAGGGTLAMFHRCRELLYPPSMTEVVAESVEKIVAAAALVAATINTSSSGSIVTPPIYAADDLVHEPLLNFPVDDTSLHLKIRLWQIVHNLLVVSASSPAATFTTSCHAAPHMDQLVRSLRSRLRVAIAVLGIKRYVFLCVCLVHLSVYLQNTISPLSILIVFIPHSHRVLSYHQSLSISAATSQLTLGEALSLRIQRSYLLSVSWLPPQFVDFGELDALFATVPSRSSATSNENEETMMSTCSICEESLSASLVAADHGTASESLAEEKLLAATCKECGIDSDRCCVTMQLITLDDVARGAVVKCPLCRSVALSEHAAAVSSSAAVTAANRDFDTFEWSWWGGRAPYCPFCVVLMVSIT